MRNIMQTFLFFLPRCKEELETIFLVERNHLGLVYRVYNKIACCGCILWVNGNCLDKIHHFVSNVLMTKSVKDTELSDQNGRVLRASFGVGNNLIELIPFGLRQRSCPQCSIGERKGTDHLRTLSIGIKTMGESHHLRVVVRIIVFGAIVKKRINVGILTAFVRLTLIDDFC